MSERVAKLREDLTKMLLELGIPVERINMAIGTLAPRAQPRIPMDIEQVEAICRLSCTDEELATYFGVTTRTIEARRADDEDFAAACERGRNQGKISLRRAQMQKALDGDKTMLIWLGKQLLGQHDNPILGIDENVFQSFAALIAAAEDHATIDVTPKPPELPEPPEDTRH